MKILIVLLLLVACTKNSDPIISQYDPHISERSTYTISGRVVWEHDDITGVNGCTVTLTGAENQTTTTDITGLYQFTVSSTGTYTVGISKGAVPFSFNGVNSADATSIQQHLTGSIPIIDFYKIVAADCNKSSNVSSLDAALIRQGILGNPSALAILNNAGSWRFIAGDYVPTIPPAPYMIPSFPITRTFNLSGDVSNVDFIGIKVGDVNGTANPSI